MSAEAPHKKTVIPAQAGIQFFAQRTAQDTWIPAFAGMTV